ncbi:MFS transporter [Heliobacterium gestii]|uniref:MFS transporter n=1 Tax=Heliomicrobium gestii TaxID=2699 RepID=A0A845LB36_HELGE|nr:MFS transporter [Heliomicrobium gestii]MBM7865629.1 MFS family permease [Heliomicrobium gestii]MZP41879.1 MFS transporter [Heliomicrobium gestii]
MSKSGFMLLRTPVVQAILLSGVFLQIGIWVRNFAVLLYVVEMTGEDPFAVSMVSVAEFAPIFLFSFIGGTFADRWRPKRTMIWCEFLSALSVFAVLLTLITGSWQAIFFTMFFSAILSQFSQPSGLKLLKLHVADDQVQEAMSLYQTVFSVFMVFGPIVGTFIFQNFGIYISLVATGLAFLLSALALLLLLPQKDPSEMTRVPSALWTEMVEGVRYVLAKRSLTLLGACFLAAGLGLGIIQPLGVFLVTERLGLPKESLQWLLTAYGIGTILGGFLTMSLANRLTPQKLLVFGMFFDALGMGITGVSTAPWLTVMSHLISGLALPSIVTGINTMILQNTETAFVGRVNGILNPLFTGAMVLTMSLAGPLKQMFPLVALYIASGACFFIGILFILPLYKLPAVAKELSSQP